MNGHWTIISGARCSNCAFSLKQKQTAPRGAVSVRHRAGLAGSADGRVGVELFAYDDLD